MILLIITIFFFVLMYKIAKESSETRERIFCKLHEWKRKPLNPDDPNGATYLVCQNCKFIFSQSDYTQYEE